MYIIKIHVHIYIKSNTDSTHLKKTHFAKQTEQQSFKTRSKKASGYSMAPNTKRTINCNTRNIGEYPS